MRTLTRPMFNMGGPIKQGIMHGIREPYKHGQRVMPSSDGSRPGYAGPAVPIGMAIWPHIARLFGGQAIKKVGQKVVGSAAQGEAAKKFLQSAATKGTQTASGTGITAAAKGSVLIANTADTISALSGSTDGDVLTYNSGTDTVSWSGSVDGGTF